MKHSILIAAAIPAAIALAACSQENAPSEKIGAAARDAAAKVAGTAAAPAPQGPFAPRDGCADIAGAAAFRADLAAAIKARDAQRLAALAAPDVRLDFGGGSGPAELVKRLADPKQDLWAELDRLATLGCAQGKTGGIVIPSYFEQDLGARDPMMTMIVTGEGVPLRAKPDSAAPAVRTLAWEAVELDGGLMPDAAFQKVKLADGATGFVASDSLRSVIDYRLLADRRDGKWAITSLVKGD